MLFTMRQDIGISAYMHGMASQQTKHTVSLQIVRLGRLQYTSLPRWGGWGAGIRGEGAGRGLVGLPACC